MKIKLGAFITDMRGRIGGFVMQKGHGCTVLRTQLSSKAEVSTLSKKGETDFTKIVKAWQLLSTANRSKWHKSVMDFTHTNVFGDVVVPSAFNLFMRLNLNLLRCGVALIVAPPQAKAIFNIQPLYILIFTNGVLLSVIYDDDTPEGFTIFVYASAPVSAGVTAKAAHYKFIKTYEYHNDLINNIATEYKAAYGWSYDLASIIWFKLVLVEKATGIASKELFISTP